MVFILLPSRIYLTFWVPSISERFYDSLYLGLKDINLVRDVAEHSTTPMPLVSLLHDRLLAGIAKGRGDMDWSALSLDVLENAGLEVPDTSTIQ